MDTKPTEEPNGRIVIVFVVLGFVILMVFVVMAALSCEG